MNTNTTNTVSRSSQAELLQAELSRNFDFELTAAQLEFVLFMQEWK